MWVKVISLAIFLDNWRLSLFNASSFVKLDTSTPFIETPEIILFDFEVIKPKINESIIKAKIIINAITIIIFFFKLLCFTFFSDVLSLGSFWFGCCLIWLFVLLVVFFEFFEEEFFWRLVWLACLIFSYISPFCIIIYNIKLQKFCSVKIKK